jgi:hypothetical protein
VGVVAAGSLGTAAILIGALAAFPDASTGRVLLPAGALALLLTVVLAGTWVRLERGTHAPVRLLLPAATVATLVAAAAGWLPVLVALVLAAL